MSRIASTLQKWNQSSYDLRAWLQFSTAVNYDKVVKFKLPKSTSGSPTWDFRASSIENAGRVWGLSKEAGDEDADVLAFSLSPFSGSMQWETGEASSTSTLCCSWPWSTPEKFCAIAEDATFWRSQNSGMAFYRLILTTNTQRNAQVWRCLHLRKVVQKVAWGFPHHFRLFPAIKKEQRATWLDIAQACAHTSTPWWLR